jgi:hypothetical protein
VNVTVSTTWCGHKGCREHYHHISMPEGLIGYPMPTGWVLKREDGQPIRPVKPGETTPRLMAVCPIHRTPGTK